MKPWLQNRHTGLWILPHMAMDLERVQNSKLPCNPNGPVLGTDMAQGEWDQLRALLRKAEDGGKFNELMTVHSKEVKNVPMNKSYPPNDDDGKDCDDGAQQPVQPSGASATSSASPPPASSKAPSGALWPEAYGDQTAWKVPPTSRQQFCNKLRQPMGSKMHENTTRNGKTGHMTPTMTLGLKRCRRMQSRMPSL